ncbi:uncharacterized protein [Lolium perenne]|uniref:uncharacterized protein n=1 Tax=Lolium perenne TaxID=4522 RepID=UPI0021EA683E|nr:uncharacterized protein LOC127298259 [Lolium perenne]
MGVTSYERLSLSSGPESRSRGGAWAAVRRSLARLCSARRQGRWAPARRMLLLVRARGRRHGRVACGYDSEGYARNFDDGVWKADEGVLPWMTAAGAGPATSSALAACTLARAVSSVR